MINDPRTMPISERYGVEVPNDALRRILVERLGQTQAEEILAAYRAATVRYQRAVRVEKARRNVRTYGHTPSENQKRWLVREERLIAAAAAYIEGGEMPHD